MDVPKSHNVDIMHPHYVMKLFAWTSWLLLPCFICLVVIWQCISKLSTWSKCLDPPLSLFMPQSSPQCAKISQCWHHVQTLCYEAFSMDLMIDTAIFHLVVDVWQCIDKLSTWSKCLDPPLPCIRTAMDVPKFHNVDILHPHYVMKLFLWTYCSSADANKL